MQPRRGPRLGLLLVILLAAFMLPGIIHAQVLTGTLIGRVEDEHGAQLSGARVTISSSTLIGGPQSMVTSDGGQLRFPSLPPGQYAFRVDLPGFASYEESELRIGVGATIERTVVLKVAGVAQAVAVDGSGSYIDARNPGLTTHFGLEDLMGLPSRRASMFDFIRAAPGISPISPSSGTITWVSAFGSGTNESQFLVDGTNFTCPCNGIARAEPGVNSSRRSSFKPWGHRRSTATFKAQSSTSSCVRGASSSGPRLRTSGRVPNLRPRRFECLS